MRAPPRWVVHSVYVRRQGVGVGDPGAPNLPASVASRYFLAPKAIIWRFLRSRWPISRQNGTPGLSTGKIKVLGNRELSRPPHSNSAIWRFNVIIPYKSNVGPSLIAPTKTPAWAAARARQRGAFKLSGWARSIPTPRPPAYSKMGFDRAL